MKLRIALAFIAIAALSRLLPHPPNFTPLAAIGLFGAAYMNRQWVAYLVPFAALFLSDLLLNNTLYAQYHEGFQWFTSVWLYAAFAVVIAVGRFLLHHRVTPGRVIFASLTASLLFFLISNLFTWLNFNMYPPTFAGLLSCYTAALPFFGNTLLGDLLFSGVLFGGYAWVTRMQMIRERA